jgi:hypothetical protein
MVFPFRRMQTLGIQYVCLPALLILLLFQELLIPFQKHAHREALIFLSDERVPSYRNVTSATPFVAGLVEL